MKSSPVFSSKLGYILSAAGSAVGLGNIWRFPYLTAKFGGGIFLLTYLILALTFGYSLLLSENCLGRMTGKGPVGTYREFCRDKKSFLRFVGIGGWLNAIIPLIIVPYYCVIGGWVTKYIFAMLCNPVSTFAKENTGASAKYFTDFITSTWQPTFFFLIFLGIMVFIIALGVINGVERFNKFLMPALVLMIVGVCIYCLCLPNAKDGLLYYLKPDTSKFSFMTIVSAMGQLFFSLSIAMGIMITYGSYMRKEDNLISNVNHVEIFDTAIAFLAGLMIIPAVVAFDGRAAAENAGPGLVFVVMPQVFANFAGGRICGVIFFTLVFFAAITSAISLLETNVQSISQELGMSREKATVIGAAEILVVGIITILGYSIFSNFHPLAFIEQYRGMDILDTLDFISNSVLMPIAAMFTTVLVVGVIGLERICGEISGGKKWRRQFAYQFCMCIIIVPCLLLILLNSIGFLK